MNGHKASYLTIETCDAGAHRPSGHNPPGSSPNKGSPLVPIPDSAVTEPRLISSTGGLHVKSYISRTALTQYRQNVVKHDFFHTIADLSFTRLFIASLLMYLSINVMFALLFLLPCLGDVNLPDVINVNKDANIRTTCSSSGAFMFSVMTISTIGGYNVRDFDVPDSARSWVVFLVFIESFMAFGMTAVMSAVIVTKAHRASRMRHRLVFSPNLCLTDDGHLKFRVCSIHSKPLTRCTVRMMYVEPKPSNRFVDMRCKCDEHAYPPGVEEPFPLSILLWTPNTIVCALPLGLSGSIPDTASFVVTVNAVDETTSVEYQARHMYGAKDVLQNHTFPVDFGGHSGDSLLAEPEGGDPGSPGRREHRIARTPRPHPSMDDLCHNNSF